jgi:Salmonella virulence plasmid 28.1kDa A protein
MATTFNSRFDTLKSFITTITGHKATELADLFEKEDGQWQKIIGALKDKDNWREEINRLEAVYRLAEWADDHTPLMRKFINGEVVSDLSAIAAEYDTPKLERLVSTTSVPTSISGKTKAEKKANYVLLLNSRLFSQKPMAVLQRLVKTENETPISDPILRGQVSRFLTKQPADFNFKTTSVYEAFKKTNAFEGLNPAEQSSVKETLKNLQRMAAISPTADAVAVLMKANLRNAYQISEMSEGQFVQAFKGKLGLSSEAQFRQIHKNATDVRLRNEQALMALKEAGQKTGIAFIDKSLGVIPSRPVNPNPTPEKNPNYALAKEVAEKNNHSWDTLFGDANYCECGECTSMYSAAAYFVELLQYLRNNNLDPNNPNVDKISGKGKAGYVGTPLEKLLDRRPDLGCLELTCKNTNTILPYVDLVNEVMESYIVHKATIVPYNVTDETSGELLAQPQHTDYEAYRILKDKVYPFTLPYHQPIDAARIYLDSLGTSRTELIKTFSVDSLTYNNAVDAEFLGLTQDEFSILTQKNFASDAISTMPLYKYYGYDTEGEMLDASESTQKGLKFVKKQFLPRTGIQYTDLVELLLTQSLNPKMPKGKAKFIAENLQFSYTFLQKFKAANGQDKLIDLLTDPAKLVELVPSLKDFTQHFEGNTSLCPPVSGTAYTLSQKDLTDWVKNDFVRIGKMLVLNSKRECIVKAGVFLTQDGQDSGDISDEGNFKISLNNKGEITAQKRVGTSFLRPFNIGEYDCATGTITIIRNAVPNLNNIKQFRPKFKSEGSAVIDGEWKGSRLVRIENNLPFSYIPPDNCDIDKDRLVHLDGTAITVEEYSNIHRFIRLWRKLGWTIAELDESLVVLKSANTDPNNLHQVTPQYLHDIVGIKKLMDKTGLSLSQLLTFWGNISTTGENSLYKRLFLSHNLRAMDNVFDMNDFGSYLSQTPLAKISQHQPIVMAALNLTADDITTLVGTDADLTLENMSTLYRNRLLARVLGLRIPAFLKVKNIFEKPFESVDATLEFMDNWEKMEAAGFDYRQLNYILKGADDAAKPIALSEKSVLILAKTLYDGLNAIETAHQDLSDDSDNNTIEFVKSKTSLLFDPSVGEQILGILEGTFIFSGTQPIENQRKKIFKIYFEDVFEKAKTIIEDAEIITDTKKVINTADFNSSIIQLQELIDKLRAFSIEKLDALIVQLEADPNPSFSFSVQELKNLRDKLLLNIEDPTTDSIDIELLMAQKTNITAAQLKDLVNSLTTATFRVKRLEDLTTQIEGGTSKPIDIPIAQLKTLLALINEHVENPANTDINLNKLLAQNTASKKRIAFLSVFLPYLRQELSHRFIIETVSNLFGLDRTTADVLISEILKIEAKTLYSIFKGIEVKSSLESIYWSAPESGEVEYTFVVKNSNAEPIVMLNSEKLNFVSNPVVATEWVSEPIKLQGGQLYKISFEKLELKNIFWKTAVLAETGIAINLNLIPNAGGEYTFILKNAPTDNAYKADFNVDGI